MVIIFLLFVSLSSQLNQLTASLYIVSFSPLLFNLSFSQPVTAPSFQLILNAIPINFTVITQTNEKMPFFLIQGNPEEIVHQNDFIIEQYALIFSQPLLIDHGRLNLNSYILRAKNVNLNSEFIGKIEPLQNKGIRYSYQTQKYSMSNLALALVSVTYFLSFSTILGLSCIHFLSIYTFYSMHFEYFTAFDYKMAFFLLFEPYQYNKEESGQFFYTSIPMIIILASFLIGLIFRFGFRKIVKRTVFWDKIYYFFSYRLFIVCFEIMILPIMASMVHLLDQSTTQLKDYKHFVAIYCYLGTVLILAYLWMEYITVNPQIEQDPRKWEIYTKTSHFHLFDAFRPNISVKEWIKRNYYLFRNVERILIVSLIPLTLSQIPLILFQVVHLVYLFIIRPFKSDFFNYSLIIMQTFVMFFYLYNHVFYLYIGIDEDMTTSYDKNNFLLSNIILVTLIILIYAVLAFYELAFRIKAFTMSLRRERRERKAIGRRGKSMIRSPLKVKDIGDETPHQEPKRRAKRREKKSLLQNIANESP